MNLKDLLLSLCLPALLAISCKSPELPELQVRGKDFVDPSGNVVVLRGVSACSPIYQKGIGQWNERCFKEIASWGANVVRMPVHPDEIHEIGIEEYFKVLDEGIGYAAANGLYVILDWHSIGNLYSGIFADEPVTIEETKQFWNAAAEHYADNNTVAIFELFNEPTTGDALELGECSWHQWRMLMEEVIDAVRAAAPRKICMVAGLDWAFDLSEIGEDPVQRDNVAYACHPYPQKVFQYPWEPVWDVKFGYLSDSYPIVCTEVGWARPGAPGACNPAVTPRPYGKLITDYFDAHGISFTAWCFDPNSAPGLIDDWDFNTTLAGGFFKSYMRRKAGLPDGGITIGTIVYNLDDIEARFKELKDAGFSSCEINYDDSKCTYDLAVRIRDLTDKYGIRVTTVVGVPGDGNEWNFRKGPSTIGLVPEAGRAEKLEVYRRMIDFCAVAEVPAMHSHFGFIPVDPSSEQYGSFITVMRELAEYAADRDILIYFETGQETPATLIRAISDIGVGNCFVNCDLANLLMYGNANSLDAVKQLGPLVKEFHAKDGHYPDPSDPYSLGAEVPIPTGDVDFPGVIRELKRVGFNGALTIECELSGSSLDYLVRTREYLQELIDAK